MLPAMTFHETSKLKLVNTYYDFKTTIQNDFIIQIKNLIKNCTIEEKKNYETYLNAFFDGILRDHKGVVIIVIVVY